MNAEANIIYGLTIYNLEYWMNFLFSQEETSSEKLIKKEEAIQSWFFSLNICPALPRIAMV